MPRSSNPAQQKARDSLAKSARRLRALRGSKLEKELDWEPADGYPAGSAYSARIGHGRLILIPHLCVRFGEDGTAVWKSSRICGISYISSFGANSERSFSGYLPGLTLEEAKLLVYQDAKRHW